MIRDRINCVAMGHGRNISPKLRNPAVEERPALLAEPLVHDRSQVAKTIDLWHKCAQASAAPDDPNNILAA